MKRIKVIGFAICLFLSCFLNAQTTGVFMNNGTTTDNSAELQIYSTTKGVLFPSLSSPQMVFIASPDSALLIFNKDISAFYFYNGSNWEKIGTLKQYNDYATFNALTKPPLVDGFTVYNKNNNSLYFYDGSGWRKLGTGTSITPH